MLKSSSKHRSLDLSQQHINKIGLALYAIIFALITLDIVGDYSDGIEWAHIAVELVVLLLAVLGLSLLGRTYYQNTQLTLHHLQTDLSRAQQEAQRWRDESRDLMQGLGVEIQKQFAPLTMGWCIDCHRKTDVKMEGNEYYTKIHEQLSKKYGVDKLTAAQMGGLECGKCHY
jgi:hypothetical protein